MKSCFLLCVQEIWVGFFKKTLGMENLLDFSGDAHGKGSSGGSSSWERRLPTPLQAEKSPFSLGDVPSPVPRLSIPQLCKNTFSLEFQPEYFPFPLWIWLCSLSLFLGVNIFRFLGILPAERSDGSSVLAVPSCANKKSSHKSSAGPSLASQEHPKCEFSCSSRRFPHLQGSACPGVSARCSFGVNNFWDGVQSQLSAP